MKKPAQHQKLPSLGKWQDTGHRFVIHQIFHGKKIFYRLYFETRKGYGAWQLNRPPSLNPADELTTHIDKRYRHEFVEFEGPLERDRGNSIVLIWDRGTCCINNEQRRDHSMKSFQHGIREGVFDIYFDGEKIKGLFSLHRPRIKNSRWVLQKKRDRFAGQRLFVFDDHSVVCGVVMKEWLDYGIPSTFSSWSDRKQTMTLQAPKKKISKISPLSVSRDGRCRIFSRIHNEKQLGFRCSQLEKVYFPKKGLKKLDILAYYYFIAPYLLPYLQDKAIVVHRYPFGVGEKGMIERSFKGDPPAFMRTVCLFEHDDVKSEAHIFADDERSLLFLANRSGIEFASWSSAIGALNCPRFAVIGLQPNQCSLKVLVDVALHIKGALEEIGIEAFCKTTGIGSSLHVCFRLKGQDDYRIVHKLMRLFALWMMQCLPDKLSLTRQRSNGKVWLNLLGMGPGRAVIAPYSLRAHPDATVATPLAWQELNLQFSAEKFTIDTIFLRLAQLGDPWKAFASSKPAHLQKAWQILKRKVNLASLNSAS
ncbi:MAG: hypothetical protein ACOH5I_11445 [Oligoflexus sp.]